MIVRDNLQFYMDIPKLHMLYLKKPSKYLSKRLRDLSHETIISVGPFDPLYSSVYNLPFK